VSPLRVVRRRRQVRYLVSQRKRENVLNIVLSPNIVGSCRKFINHRDHCMKHQIVGGSKSFGIHIQSKSDLSHGILCALLSPKSFKHGRPPLSWLPGLLISTRQFLFFLLSSLHGMLSCHGSLTEETCSMTEEQHHGHDRIHHGTEERTRREQHHPPCHPPHDVCNHPHGRHARGEHHGHGASRRHRPSYLGSVKNLILLCAHWVYLPRGGACERCCLMCVAGTISAGR